jgi:hypothetical protein
MGLIAPGSRVLAANCAQAGEIGGFPLGGNPMKRFRHGSSGSWMPGLIDALGALRDLFGGVAGIADTSLTPDSMARRPRCT